jgi:formylmethanofuran dehydrogenase subunit C
MKPLVLALRDRPDQRLDLSRLTPDLLAGLSAADIAGIELQTTRARATVGDVFRVRAGDPQRIRIEDSCDRLDRVGHEMIGGEILVEGDVGVQAGRAMAGGRLIINGHAGPFAASAMRGGYLEISGDAGDMLGAPLAGEMAGMRGGLVVVRRNVGERAGDRMRRGMIVVEGRAGEFAGSRMIAGSLLIGREAAGFPGYLMRRGTIVLGEGCAELSPTFLDCGVHELVALRLMRAFVAPHSARIAKLLARPLRRFAGDMAVLGKGETFLGIAR